VGQVLSQLPIDAIYCSPLQRAKSTADIIQASFDNPPPLFPTEDLLEIDLPLWENWVKEDVLAQYPEEYHCWHERPQALKMLRPDGQTEFFPVLSLYEQAQAFWQTLLPQYEGKTVVIVAHLDIPLPPPRSSQNRLRFLLIRHGETQWNRESRFQGIRDIPLNDNGRGQAQKAADFLKEISINTGISSPMLRPKETAEIILQYHPDVSLDLQEPLTEICHGLWEGKLESEIEADFPGLLEQWKNAPETVQMPEGENLQQVWDRAIACWEERVNYYSQHQEQTIGIVVAHDAINKVILCYLLGLTPANFWNIKQGNGGVSVIDYPQGLDSTPILQAINLTTHLGGVLDKTAAGAL
jgi:probable phosphoglycerate mutase